MKLALRRLRRGCQTVAFDVVKPAVVSACNAALFDSAIAKRNTAVGAAVMQQTDLVVGSAKQHQILAEDADEFRRRLGCQVRRNRHRVPITAQQFAGWSSRSDPSQYFVFFCGQLFALLFNGDCSALVPSSQSSIFDLQLFRPARISSISLIAGLMSLVSGSSISKYFMP